MRIAFFGSPQFAVPTLERLIASGHQVVVVVTQPDRPRGRGHHVSEGPVKAAARAHAIPVLQPERLKTAEFQSSLSACSPELGVVAAYGKILPPDVLTIPGLGIINVHASLLPRWRGAAPVERAVMAGDADTGVTIMRIVAALDAGPMFARMKRPIGPDETAEEVERDLSRMGADLLVDVVGQLAAGRAHETPQDDRLATYAPRLTREDGVVDWHQPATAIHNQVRALRAWPHACTFMRGARYIILRTSLDGARRTDEAAGTVLDADGDRLAVATGAGVLLVEQIQAEGRRPMTTREFLAGHPLPPGSRFS